MTIRLDEDTVVLEDVCDVEDAETLLQYVQAGAVSIDWSACTHLHTACAQVILAARLPMRGTPDNPALARWLAPIFQAGAAPGRPAASANPSLEHLSERGA